MNTKVSSTSKISSPFFLTLQWINYMYTQPNFFKMNNPTISTILSSWKLIFPHENLIFPHETRMHKNDINMGSIHYSESCGNIIFSCRISVSYLPAHCLPILSINLSLILLRERPSRAQTVCSPNKSRHFCHPRN